MTFDDVVGNRSDYKDGDCYRQYCQKIIEAMGIRNVRDCIPFSEEELREAYKEDEHFNNLSKQKWDAAAGFDTGRKGDRCRFIGSRLTRLYWDKLRVNQFSCSEGVCILKECARMTLQRTEGRQ